MYKLFLILILTASSLAQVKDSRRSAELLLIHPTDDNSLFDDYKLYKESKDISTEIVSLSEILNDFSENQATSDNIKDYIEWIYNNGLVTPKYIFFVGSREQIPTIFLENPLPNFSGELIISDNSYGIINGERKISVGRFPGDFFSQFLAYFNKQEYLDQFGYANNSTAIIDSINNSGADRNDLFTGVFDDIKENEFVISGIDLSDENAKSDIQEIVTNGTDNIFNIANSNAEVFSFANLDSKFFENLGERPYSVFNLSYSWDSDVDEKSELY